MTRQGLSDLNRISRKITDPQFDELHNKDSSFGVLRSIIKGVATGEVSVDTAIRMCWVEGNPYFAGRPTSMFDILQALSKVPLGLMDPRPFSFSSSDRKSVV